MPLALLRLDHFIAFKFFELLLVLIPDQNRLVIVVVEGLALHLRLASSPDLINVFEFKYHL